MPDPWRYRCPEGHTSVARRERGYRCRSCEATYEGDPVDVKRDDCDGADHTRDSVLIALDALRLLARAGGAERWVWAHEAAPDRTQSFAQKIRESVERGYVKRLERSLGYRYRLTDAGERVVGNTDRVTA